MKLPIRNSVCIFGIIALGAVALHAAEGKAPAETKSFDSREFVFMGEARPILVRLHVIVDGKPLPNAADEFFKFLFNYLDTNHDGALGKDEVDRAPTLDQIMTGGISIANGGGGGGGKGKGRTEPSRPTMSDMDTNKDGKVTADELFAYYRKNGFRSFQFQLDGSPTKGFNLASILGGGRNEPAVKEVRESIFALVDTNHDGKLSKEELAAASSVLMKYDEDDDEALTTKELTPNAAPPNPLALGFMMAGRQNKKDPLAGNKFLTPVTPAHTETDSLVTRLLERYGPESDKPEQKKLSRAHIGLAVAVFDRLDANKDGILDSTELAAFAKREPDVEFVIRLGKKTKTETGIALTNDKNRSAHPADRLFLKDGSVQLDMGRTRAEIRLDETELPDRLSGIIRQQITAQFQQADANSDGFLDEKEAQANRTFKSVFKAMDRAGKGKVTEKELNAYLDDYHDLQVKAAAACVTLSLTDESRGLFDLLDADRDNRLSVRELQQAPKLLVSFDRAGKGFLTADDVPFGYLMQVRRGVADAGLAGANAFAALYSGGYDTETKAVSNAGPLWFRKMDRNRDGDVSRKEFLGTEDEFRKIDTNGDGLISVDEAIGYDSLMRNSK